MAPLDLAAAWAMPRGPSAYRRGSISRLRGKKFRSVHKKWNGRCDRLGVKLQHGSVQFICAMRALRRLHGDGAAG
jgi:hypothetical protein